MFPQPNSVCSLPGAQEPRHHPNIFHGFIAHKPRPASQLPWLLPRQLHTGMGSWGSPVILLLSLQRGSRKKLNRDSNFTPSSAPGFCHFLLGPPAVRDHQPPRRLFPSSQDPRTVIEGKAHQPGSVDKEEALEGGLPRTGLQVSGWRRHKGVARTCILGRQTRDGGVGRTGNRFCGWALTLSSLQPVSCLLSLSHFDRRGNRR